MRRSTAACHPEPVEGHTPASNAAAAPTLDAKRARLFMRTSSERNQRVANVLHPPRHFRRATGLALRCRRLPSRWRHHF
jgi:hypothetical protein